MKSLTDRVLHSRKKAFEFSQRAVKSATSQSRDILSAPKRVKKKRAIAGCYSGISIIGVGVILYLNRLYGFSNGMIILGILTLGVNLLILVYLNKQMFGNN